jgi:transposase
MRGQREVQPGFISLINVEHLIARDHPVRRIKATVDEVLRRMEPLFDAMYASQGRPSIPPEQLLKAKVLQALFTVRSDRQLCARLQTDLMFRWFIDLGLDAKVFDASSFSQNQKRLLAHEVAGRFFAEVVDLAREQGWVSDEPFSVDGTLIEGWASLKSFRPKSEIEAGGAGPGPGNPWMDFSGEKRSNETHVSTTDPEVKLARKAAGQAAKLCFGAHATMENRHGLCVSFDVREVAAKTSESRVAAEQIVGLQKRGFQPKTVGADKGYHTHHFVETLRENGVEAHAALVKGWDLMGMVVDTAHAVSQRIRKRIEEIFGWVKTTGGFRKSRHRGVARTHAAGQMVVATLNLLRMAKLAGAR